MSKQKHIFIVFCVGFLSFNATAQGVSFYIGAGTSQFLGDLGGKPTLGTDDPTDLDFPATRWVLNGGFRFHFSRTFAIRTNFAYGRLAGNDRFTTNRERRQRNLSFSPITEGSVALEVNLGKEKRWYLYGGVGIFKFNPKTRYNGQTYALKQYGTEGQFFLPGRKPYSLTAFSFPFGIGYKIIQTANGGYFSLEYCFRKSTTDYIDDVSTQFVDPVALTASNGSIAAELSDRSLPGIPGFSLPGNIRGDPTDMDNFSFFTINYNIVLGGNGGSDFGGNGGRHRGRQKCPDMGF